MSEPRGRSKDQESGEELSEKEEEEIMVGEEEIVLTPKDMLIVKFAEQRSHLRAGPKALVMFSRIGFVRFPHRKQVLLGVRRSTEMPKSETKTAELLVEKFLDKGSVVGTSNGTSNDAQRFVVKFGNSTMKTMAVYLRRIEIRSVVYWCATSPEGQVEPLAHFLCNLIRVEASFWVKDLSHSAAVDEYISEMQRYVDATSVERFVQLLTNPSSTSEAPPRPETAGSRVEEGGEENPFVNIEVINHRLPDNPLIPTNFPDRLRLLEDFKVADDVTIASWAMTHLNQQLHIILHCFPTTRLSVLDKITEFGKQHQCADSIMNALITMDTVQNDLAHLSKEQLPDGFKSTKLKKDTFIALFDLTSSYFEKIHRSNVQTNEMSDQIRNLLSEIDRMTSEIDSLRGRNSLLQSRNDQLEEQVRLLSPPQHNRPPPQRNDANGLSPAQYNGANGDRGSSRRHGRGERGRRGSRIRNGPRHEGQGTSVAASPRFYRERESDMVPGRTKKQRRN